MAFELPPLPFEISALARKNMCQETLEFHHGKHHQAYVTALNGLVDAKPEYQGKSLAEIVIAARNKPSDTPVFNNAGQHMNHCICWDSLSPDGGKLPGKLEAKIVEDFGSVEAFKTTFKTAATTQFGSGWAWLVLGKNGKLAVTKTANAANPLSEEQGKILLCADVWEHAYYIDYRNRRPDYISNYLDNLANYAFAEANLLAA